MIYKRIGILGGMGAAASVRFLDLLVKECQKNGAAKDSDFPQIILYSMNSKGMDETGVVDEFVMRHDLINGVMFLNRAQCDVIIMACNSVHKYIEYLQGFSDAFIENMVKKACEECYGLKKVGVLCSQTAKSLYKEYLDKIGIEMVETEYQDDVDGLISKAICEPNLSPLIHRMNIQVKHLLEKGAERVIIGCTELSLIPCTQRHVIYPEELVIQEVLDA
jgi:aspartate racemase